MTQEPFCFLPHSRSKESFAKETAKKLKLTPSFVTRVIFIRECTRVLVK